ncbi:MAG TPA: hypothetical protein VMU68_12460 [Acidimicrobiales bacterium]|nr:hypothetical protein [Acidimicrobiales bacterium]
MSIRVDIADDSVPTRRPLSAGKITNNILRLFGQGPARIFEPAVFNLNTVSLFGS